MGFHPGSMALVGKVMVMVTTLLIHRAEKDSGEP